MYEKGKTTSIKAVLTIGYDSVTSKPIEVVKEGIVMCVEKQLPVVQAVYFTLSNDGDSVYYKKGDKENKVVCVGDGDYVLEVLFQYSDQSVKTPAEIGAIAKSETEMVAMIGGQGSSGGSYIIPNMTGQALIRFYVDNKVVPGADVAFSVQEARKATRVIATPDKNTLNIGVPDDSIEITAKVLDQYNTEMKNVPLYITQTEASLKNVSASFGSFDAKGKLLIQSSQCSIIGSLPSYPVIANVTNGGNLSCPISFNVKSVPYDSTKLASYEGEVILEGNKDANGQVVIDTTLKQGNQEFEDTVAYIRFSSNDGTGKYAVKETAGVLLSTAPTTSLKPSDLNTTAGNSVVAMTIQYKPDNGQQVFITSAANIDVSEFVIGFTPVKSGSKLAKGIYTLMGYVITFTDSSTIIKPLGAKQITVKESTLGGTITQKKETYAAAGSMEQRVAEFFDFYLEGAKLDPTMIKSVEHNDSSANNSSYIVSVTFALSNSVYGSFDLKIPVNRLIKFSA